MESALGRANLWPGADRRRAGRAGASRGGDSAAEKEFDYAAKYQTGGAGEPVPGAITPEQQAAMGDIALRLHHTLGLEVYSRTDFLMDADGHFWCLEVNSLPGMTSASLVPKEAAAVGMSYNALCEEIVQQSYCLKRRT